MNTPTLTHLVHSVHVAQKGLRPYWVLAFLWLLPACGEDAGKTPNGDATGGQTGSGGSHAASGGGNGTGGSSSGTGGTAGMPAEMPDVETSLPDLPGMSNVTITPGDHNLTIRFDPVEGAVDYRIYALPKDEDVVIAADSTLEAVTNATYRCAGTHEAANIAKDGELDPHYNNCEAFAIVDSSQPYEEHCGTGTGCYPTAGGIGNHFGEGGYSRKPDEASLGYVYTTDAAGRVPVHAFISTDRKDFYDCGGHAWDASRMRRYSADPGEWDGLKAAGWFDQGVVFFGASPDEAGAQPVYTSAIPRGSSTSYYYYLDGAEHDLRSGAGQPVAPAFSTLTAASSNDSGTPTSLPLYRVLYSMSFGDLQHDELAVGTARFESLYGQGQSQSSHSITYSYTGSPPETLVLEALDQGCPFQGNLGDKTIASTDLFHAWTTFADVQASAAHGEVFVNGHYDAASQPKPVARAFITPASTARAPMDFLSQYEEADEVFTENPPSTCNEDNFNCDAGTLHRLTSANYDASFNGIDGERWNLFSRFGQLWSAYSDAGADVGAYFRLSPKVAASMADDSFLHVTMDTTSMSSARRYPQIIINDQLDTDAWISVRQGNGKTIILQPIGDWPSELQLQICEDRPWAVNDQCPHFDMFRVSDSKIAPTPELGDVAGEDRLNRFEIYASTSRAYVFLDGAPYGCVDYDGGTVPSGAVRVSFGDVVYHSGVDQEFVAVLDSGFHATHKLTLAERRFGNLGYSSGVPAPTWDETAFPCVNTLK